MKKNNPAITEIYIKTIRKKIDKQDVSIPVLSKVASQVFTITKDINAGMAKIADLVHRDQSLAGHLLKAANSSAVSSRVEIQSIHQAVQLLGARMISQVAMSIIVGKNFFRTNSYKDIVQRLRLLSLISSQYAREISSNMNLNTEQLYLCGLIHNIGKPVIVQLVAQIDERSGGTLNEDQFDLLFDNYHIEIEELIAEKWNLPQMITSVALNYHQYDKIDEFQTEAAVINLADKLARLSISEDDTQRESLTTDPVVAFLGLSENDIIDLFEKREDIKEIANGLMF